MKDIDIFTDGSHLKSLGNTGRLGIGGVILHNGKKIGELSEEVDRSYILDRYGEYNISNPTIEMYAVLRSIIRFSELNLISKSDNISLYSDYKGVSEWMNNNWRVNETYIKKIKLDIDNIINSLNLTIKFKWVKGHSTKTDYYSKWNNEADKLANPR